MTDEKLKKMLNKVANLMSKTVENGCSPDEAALAASKAQELIAKYHLDMKELSDEDEGVTEGRLYATRKWQKFLAWTVANNMCCRAVFYRRRKSYLLFIGREADRLACMDTYESLAEAIRIGAREAKRKYGGRGIEESYASGFVRAVSVAMSEQCRALALVVPEEVNKVLETKNCKTTRARLTSSCTSAYNDGYSDGMDKTSRKRIG